MAKPTNPKPKLNESTLYLGDNGRCFCGALRCAGMTARFTGRDLSGQRVLPLVGKTLDAARAEGLDPKSEMCGKTAAA